MNRRNTEFHVIDDRKGDGGWILKGYIVLPEDTDEQSHDAIQHRFISIRHLLAFLKRMLLP